MASGSIPAALGVLKSVASADPDHARIANGRGFAKSNVTLGHLLAGMHPCAFRGNSGLQGRAMRLAARYRRQVTASMAYDAGATGQMDLFA